MFQIQRKLDKVYGRILCVLSVVAVVVALNSSSLQADVISVTKFGDPVWEPVDFHLFTAPVGDGVGNPAFEEFKNTATTILPEPEYVFNPLLFVGPLLIVVLLLGHCCCRCCCCCCCSCWAIADVAVVVGPLIF